MFSGAHTSDCLWEANKLPCISYHVAKVPGESICLSGCVVDLL